MLFAVDFHVRISQLPETKKDLKMRKIFYKFLSKNLQNYSTTVDNPLANSREIFSTCVTISKKQAQAQRQKELEAAYGKNLLGLSKKLDRDGLSLKMLPICETKDLTKLYKIYGRSGMHVNGILYQLAPLVPVISEKDCGLLPTPTKTDPNRAYHYKPGTKEKVYSLEGLAKNGSIDLPTPQATDSWNTRDSRKRFNRTGTKDYNEKKANNPVCQDLYTALTKFTLPTPTCRDSGSPLPPRKKNKTGGQKPPLVSVIGGKLNPTFVEWMMGYPKNWTLIEKNESNNSETQ